MLDSSRWIFSNYQTFVIFSTRLLKKFKFKIVHWHTWHGQLGQLIRDGGSSNYCIENCVINK